MKILITGGAGFIASHIADKLIDDKHDIVIIDNLITGKKENININSKFYECDITETSVRDIITSEKPEIIYHFAAQVKVSKSMIDVKYDANSNIIGTINILEGAKKAGTRKIIYSSSAAVYGSPAYLPITEEHPIGPLSFYGASKYIGEYYIRLYQDLHGIEYTVLRFANVYGTRQVADSDGGVVAIFVNNILNEKPVIIYGTGMQTRDFIYVKDIVNAAVCALGRGNNEVVNVSCNTQDTINDLICILRRVTGVNIEVINREFRPGDIIDSRLDNKRALAVLGWEPNYSLHQGLKEIIEHYK